MERDLYNIKQTKERNSRTDAQPPYISNKLNIKPWSIIVYTHPLETKTANNTHTYKYIYIYIYTHTEVTYYLSLIITNIYIEIYCKNLP